MADWDGDGRFGRLRCLGTLVITALTVPGRPGRWVGKAFWSCGERLSSSWF